MRATWMLSAGSSPRPWGTLEHLQRAGGEGRFIPTPVGNACPWPSNCRPRAVHPHARGERAMPPVEKIGVFGSSPRPWGTRWPQGGDRERPRFIPTPVGNASALICTPPASPVHPHARGERASHSARVTSSAGSSPRPWGTRAPVRRRQHGVRFIPTPVGNASLMQAGRFKEFGSSPRPWGTQLLPLLVALLERFIPTPVGNAPALRPAWQATTVHPHARGERVLAARAVAGVVRFIPTPVGNAAVEQKRSAGHSVHPHARGERGTNPA